MLPSLEKAQIAQIGKNVVAASQNRKEKSVKLKDTVSSVEDKATCTITAKKEMMAKAKKPKLVKRILKKPR